MPYSKWSDKQVLDGLVSTDYDISVLEQMRADEGLSEVKSEQLETLYEKWGELMAQCKKRKLNPEMISGAKV